MGFRIASRWFEHCRHMKGARMRELVLPALAGWLTCSLLSPAHAVGQRSEWHWANIHDHKMFYAERGIGGTLVLLHGGGDSGEH